MANWQELAERWAEKQQFIVIRVNGDDSDTHAARTLEEAMGLALPDPEDTVEWFIANVGLHQDAGWARLVKPSAPVSWQPLLADNVPSKFRD